MEESVEEASKKNGTNCHEPDCHKHHAFMAADLATYVNVQQGRQRAILALSGVEPRGQATMFYPGQPELPVMVTHALKLDNIVMRSEQSTGPVEVWLVSVVPIKHLERRANQARALRELNRYIRMAGCLGYACPKAVADPRTLREQRHQPMFDKLERGETEPESGETEE